MLNNLDFYKLFEPELSPKKMLEYEKSIIIPKGIDQSDNKIVVEPVVKFIK